MTHSLPPFPILDVNSPWEAMAKTVGFHLPSVSNQGRWYLTKNSRLISSNSKFVEVKFLVSAAITLGDPFSTQPPLTGWKLSLSEESWGYCGLCYSCPSFIIGWRFYPGRSKLKRQELTTPYPVFGTYLRDFSQENRQSVKTESSETFSKGIYFHLKQNVENFN